MLSNKDINFDDERQILTINGEAHPVGATIYQWNYGIESLNLTGFDKTRVIIGNSGVDATGAVYIGVLIGENQINLQNTADPGGSTPRPYISKTSTGWNIGRASGQSITAKCIIFEF